MILNNILFINQKFHHINLQINIDQYKYVVICHSDLNLKFDYFMHIYFMMDKGLVTCIDFEIKFINL